MCMVLAGGASRFDRRRLVQSLGIFAGLAFFAAPGTAQDCGDSISRPSAESTDRLLQVADCHRASGRFERALVLLDSAAARGRSGGLAETIAIHGRLGQLHIARGDYPAAIEHLKLAIDATPPATAAPDAAALLNDLGGAYLANDQPLLGLAAFADSARVSPSASTIEATATLNALRALHETGTPVDGAQLDRARDSIHALPATGKAPLLLALVELRRELAASLESAPQQPPSLELASEALALAEAADDTALIAAAHGELGAEHAAAGNLEPALQHTRRAAQLAQDADLAEQQYRFESQLVRMLRDAGRPNDALLAYEAAVGTLNRTTLAAATSRRGFRRDVLPLYEEYGDLKLAATRGSTGADTTVALRALQRNLEQLRIAEIRNYFENQCSVPVVFDRPPDIDRAVVVYPMSFADRLELLVSSGDDLAQITVPVSDAELTRTVRLLRDAIERSDSGLDYLAHAQQLYAWLIEPLHDVLERAEPSTLVFVPAGPLRTIPLAVLHDGERFLIETSSRRRRVVARHRRRAREPRPGTASLPTRGFMAAVRRRRAAQHQQTFPSRLPTTSS
jgi:tetratricopeptide (TPR) repeat protein